MKNISSKIKGTLQLFILGLTILLVASCDKDVEVFATDDLQINTEFPDLRYSDIEDVYYFPATFDSSNTFQVKSLYHNWEITSITGSSWCNIDPGEGEAGTLYEVEVYPEDNTVLDDRVDTFALSSEAWTGATFVVYQKGTAYLRAVAENTTLAETVGDVLSFSIESNQNWTAKVEDGIDWMEIQSGSSGTGNGTVSVVSTQVNSLLRKEGKVYIYDRYDVLSDSVTIYQNGIYLEFTSVPEQVGRLGGTVEIALSSNSDWVITIPESAESWLSVDQTSGSDDATVTFTIGENDGPFRSAYVLVETDPALVADSVNIQQLGAIPFTEEYWNSNSSVTFNDDGSATLYAGPGTGSRNLKSKITDFSYGKYTVYFSDIQIPSSSCTMLMSISAPDAVVGGIAWGCFANSNYSDSWASEYWLYDNFGSTQRQRFDNDILRDDVEKFIVDVRKSDDEGMVDIDFYINDQLLKSVQAVDGFASGGEYCVNFWIYNYYNKTEAAVFEPISLLYEPYNY